MRQHCQEDSHQQRPLQRAGTAHLPSPPRHPVSPVSPSLLSARYAQLFSQRETYFKVFKVAMGRLQNVERCFDLMLRSDSFCFSSPLADCLWMHWLVWCNVCCTKTRAAAVTSSEIVGPIPDPCVGQVSVAETLRHKEVPEAAHVHCWLFPHVTANCSFLP